MFRTLRALAASYVDPYVDFTGHITSYAVVDLRTAIDLAIDLGLPYEWAR